MVAHEIDWSQNYRPSISLLGHEGDQVSLSDVWGFDSLEQLSDNLIAVEHHEQSEHPPRMRLWVLKCRETGETRPADYNSAQGRDEPTQPAHTNQRSSVNFFYSRKIGPGNLGLLQQYRQQAAVSICIEEADFSF